jgi:hypothetical protein
MSNAERNLAVAIENVIVARPGRLPRNFWQINALAVSAVCPNMFISQRARIDFLAGLISEPLVAADVLIDGSKPLVVTF